MQGDPLRRVWAGGGSKADEAWGGIRTPGQQVLVARGVLEARYPASRGNVTPIAQAKASALAMPATSGWPVRL